MKILREKMDDLVNKWFLSCSSRIKLIKELKEGKTDEI